MERTEPEFYRCRPVWYQGVPVVEDVDWCLPMTEDQRQEAFRHILVSAALTGKASLPPGLPNRFPRPLVWIGGSGKRWPNLFVGWPQENTVLVHERVAEALRASPLRGYRLAEAELGSFAAGRKPFNTPVPNYLILEATGQMDYSLRIYERLEEGRRHDFLFETENAGTDPRMAEIWKGHGRYPQRQMPSKGTWDGSDFFALRHDGIRKSELCCTHRFLELARSQDWSGFAFHPLDALGESWMDFRKRPWPPSQWYPASQPD